MGGGGGRGQNDMLLMRNVDRFWSSPPRDVDYVWSFESPTASLDEGGETITLFSDGAKNFTPWFA